MTSQAPADDSQGAPKRYEDAWTTTRILTTQEGFSWSGNEKNHAFINIGDLRFADVSPLSAADCSGDGRAVVVLDWDDDGRVDFLLKNRTGPRLQLFHNRYQGSGHYLFVELAGNGTTTNRDAVGSTVEVDLGDRVLRRTLHASEGFLAQSSKRLHFGLGGADRIERLTVHWTDGTRSSFEDLSADGRVRVVQGNDELESLPARTTTALAEAEHAPLEKDTGGVRRVVLASPLPMAEVPVPGFAAARRRVQDLAGSPVLLSLWQTTCEACLRELSEFGERKDEFAKAGLRLVPMNTDPRTESGRILAQLRQFDLGEDSGYWNDELSTYLEFLFEEIFGERSNKDLTLPLNLLIDPHGDLVAIYFGRVELETLFADTAQLLEESELPATARLAGGRRLVYYKRDLEALADRLDKAIIPELADYYRRVDAETNHFYFEDGEKKLIPTNRAEAPRKSSATDEGCADESG